MSGYTAPAVGRLRGLAGSEGRADDRDRPSQPLDRLRNHGQPDDQGQPSRRLSDFRVDRRSDLIGFNRISPIPIAWSSCLGW